VPVLESRLELEPDDEDVGNGVVPETTGLPVIGFVVAMFVSSDPDVDAAARTETRKRFSTGAVVRPMFASCFQHRLW